jgi:hypothetical protein
MYRFGWRKADKIEYYSHFLGVSDEIVDSDMVVGEDKNVIEKLKKDNEDLKKDFEEFKNVFVQDLTKTLMKKFKFKEEDISISSRGD